ncbi:hypothetical protein BD410DRAFT_825688 [Rickenella mellea]|uniref:F-box domain-containing protein n=1 Tax=Rickenella mellea TaxID=50990 RepID=A0A4Y7QHF9_9AGAM|nr:hypothetical protein BD410DRAFT_825688 [Rickenella mellea]
MTPSLPTELWRTIFRHATSAAVDADLAIKHPKPEPLWFDKFEQHNLEEMKTKIALTRVSHRFRRIASEFLFEFVSIGDSDRAVILLETMMKQSSNTALGPKPHELVKFLFVRCSRTRLVTKILYLCRGLRGFSWNAPDSQTRFQNWAAVQDEMIQNIPTNIRFLNWNARVDQTNTFAAFLHKASASLQILYISGVPAFQQPLQHVSYSALTHLRVEDTSPFGCLATWTMPSLIYLDLVARYTGGSSPTFFPNFGKRLRVLRLGRSFTLLRPLLSHILKSHPNMEEIHYHCSTFRRSSLWKSDVTHMKLKVVGVGIAETNLMDIAIAHSELRKNFGTISRTRFPGLDRIIVDVVESSPLIPKGTSLLMTRVSKNFRSAEITMI